MHYKCTNCEVLYRFAYHLHESCNFIQSYPPSGAQNPVSWHQISQKQHTRSVNNLTCEQRHQPAVPRTELTRSPRAEVGREVILLELETPQVRRVHGMLRRYQQLRSVGHRQGDGAGGGGHGTHLRLEWPVAEMTENRTLYFTHVASVQRLI